MANFDEACARLVAARIAAHSANAELKAANEALTKAMVDAKTAAVDYSHRDGVEYAFKLDLPDPAVKVLKLGKLTRKG